MAYKIAVASSDGVNIDLHFGATSIFMIYKVEGLDYSFIEKRIVENADDISRNNCQNGCRENNENCCNTGCHSGGGTTSIDVVTDCRAVVAVQTGKNVRKQLETKAISVFDVQIPVKEALSKISSYYYKIDNRVFRL